MDSLKRGRYDFFLIICSELILNGSCGEKGNVFCRNPQPVLGIFIGKNAIAYCDSTLNGVLIRTGQQRTPASAPYTGANTGVRESSKESYGGKPTSVLLLYTTLIISISIRNRVLYRFMFYSELPFFLFRFHVCIRLSRASFALSSHGVGLFRIFISQNVIERFMSRCTLKALEM